LSSFVYLGGIVKEEFVEMKREASLGGIKSKPIEPPKPLSEMTEAEKQSWQEEKQKQEKKLEMQSQLEKNLQQKLKHGEQPITPPSQGGLIGKAKKKMQQAQEKVASKAEEATAHKETVEERIKRQAMAGAGGSLTGGATAALGQDIANSQQMRDLEKRRKEVAKQEELKKKQEEVQRKKQEEEKKKNQPKGLSDFLKKVESNETMSVTNEAAAKHNSSAAPAKRLNAFLSSAESDRALNDAPVSESPISAKSPEQQTNKLSSFLQTTSSPSTPAKALPEERPKSEKRASAVSSVMGRLSMKSSEPKVEEKPPVVDIHASAEPDETLVAEMEQDAPAAPTAAQSVEVEEATKPKVAVLMKTEEAPIVAEIENPREPESILASEPKEIPFMAAVTTEVEEPTAIAAEPEVSRYEPDETLVAAMESDAPESSE